MALCVATFLTATLSGINFSVLMVVEGTGGLFLGITMRNRWRHLPLLFVGVTCGAIALFSLIVLSYLLLGIPLSDLVRGMHQAFTAALAVMNPLATSLGLGATWQHSVLPMVNSVANLAFTHWLATLYVVSWIGLCPVVAGIYYLTGLFVRLLGYEVRPFPGGRLQKLLRWLAQKVTRWIGKSPLGKRPAMHTLLRQIRLYIGRI